MPIVIGVSGYCDLADIQNALQRTFDEGSSPTSDDVLEIIEDEFAIINSILNGLDITTPVTPAQSPLSVRVLKNIHTKGAAAEAERRAAEADGGSVERAQELKVEYKDLLDRLGGKGSKAKLELPDAVKGDNTPTSAAAATPASNPPKNATTGEVSPPRFGDDIEF